MLTINEDWLEAPLNRVGEFLVPYPANALVAMASEAMPAHWLPLPEKTKPILPRTALLTAANVVGLPSRNASSVSIKAACDPAGMTSQIA